jgi:hypothetical protein
MQGLVEESQRSGTIPYTNPNDVLVGRGRPYQTFPGNIMLSNLIDTQYLDRYIQTNRVEKTRMHLEAIETVQNSFGGRFIKRTSEGWNVVDEIAARKKVGSAPCSYCSGII